MLIPLTREKFEQLVPLIATGPQYAHHWKNAQNFLKQFLISVVGVVVMLIVGSFLGESGESITLILCLVAGLYWLWGPVYWSSIRNAAYRRYPYSGFLRGQILDVYITEELVGEEETVNKRGELVIIENRERRINLEVGDENFRATVQAPLRRIHKAIAPGQVAELVVLSKQPDLYPVDKITDVYIPQHKLWIGDYPSLQRDVFAEVSRQLGGSTAPPRRRASEIRRRTR